jgi:phosphomannomutase / phosphoglucomutase
MHVFGSSGVRGVANDDLNPEFVLRVAMAVGTVWGSDRAVMARDTRATGRMFADAAATGLQSVGIDVHRLGILPTPGVQAYADREGIPGLVITASHNPPQYNGLKVIGADGIEFPIAGLEAIESVLETERFTRADWNATGEERWVEGSKQGYVRDLLGAVDRERIAGSELTVALDPGHGAGSLTSPEFFRRLGCRVLTLNAQPDGSFPGRNPEPVPGNLRELGRLVATSDADLGIAHDGDADRAIFFDERGVCIPGDVSFAALAAAELGAGDTVVSAVTASQRLRDVATAAGATLELTPVGSTNIVSTITDHQASGASVPIAGEGNGGVLFPDYRLARDGAYAGAKFLELLADRPASEVGSTADDYHNVRHGFEYRSEAEREAIIEAIEAEARGSDGDLDTTDGFRLEYDDGWVLARASGTEPLVRVYAEARERVRAEELAGRMERAIERARASVEA